MHQNNKGQRPLIKQRKLSDHRERERLLATYAGIFPNSISEFAKVLGKKNKIKKDYTL